MRNYFNHKLLLWILVPLVAVMVVGVFWIVAKKGNQHPDAVFFIVVDTLRPDRLSCYGYQAHQTPNIDRLARRGVRFEYAQSVASWTIPSMGAMFTSLYPTQLGLVEKKAPAQKRFRWNEKRKQVAPTLSLTEKTLAEVLSEYGLLTAAFVDQPGLVVGEGFLQGFSDFYYPFDTDSIRRRLPGDKMKPKRWLPFLTNAAYIDLSLVLKFDEWLSRHADDKMFVWVHLLTPHRPYNPPAGFEPGEEHKSNLSMMYNGEVLFSDNLIGRLIQSIEDHVGWSRSVVIFTSDHGEAFGEHGMYDHGHSLHKEVINVPLIIVAPNFPAGKVISSYVRTIDYYPTILELLNIELPRDSQIHGTSLLALIDGDEHDRQIYSEAMLYGSTERCLIADNLKLMYDEQDEQYSLYYLPTDHLEEQNIFDPQLNQAQILRKSLSDFYDDLVLDYLHRFDNIPADSMMSKEELRKHLDALKALGYISE